MDKKSLPNIPNILSIYRIAAIPLLIFLIFKEEEKLFAWAFAFSLFTDIADGFIARKLHQETKTGSSLDSIGDALTFVMGVFGAWMFHKDFILEHSVLVGTVVGSYLLQIAIASIKYGKPSSFHTYLAKLSALLQGFFLILLFLHGPIMWLFYITMVITILEIAEEIILVLLIPKWRSNVKGLYWVLTENKND